MTIAEFCIQELKHEGATTRKYLERLPEDQFGYAPHPKSMKLGALAGHLAETPGWVKDTIALDEMVFDMANYVPFSPTTRDEVLAKFDEALATGIAALQGVSDEHVMKNWRMVVDGKVFFEMPRVMVLRNMVLNHSVHHRAQLGVYLRMLDVPVPSTYGPSADEQ